jgi:hypothetical protein
VGGGKGKGKGKEIKDNDSKIADPVTTSSNVMTEPCTRVWY